MSKGTTQKTTENSSQQSPAYVQDAAKYTINAGQNMTSPFLQMGNNALAGFTPDQLAAFDISRGIASDRQDNTYKWFQGARDYVGDNTYKPYEAAQVDPADITKQMNPFITGVVDTTRKAMDSQWRDQDAAIAGRYASANAFGGSGEALARGTLAKGFGENLATTTAQLMAQGYSQAQATALANAQMRQQAASGNATAMAAGEDTRRARGMSGLQMGSALESEDLQRRLLGLQTLLSSGDAQQGQVQKSLDIPWTMLGRLAGFTPQDASMTKQGEKETESSGGGSILSGLMGLASLPMGGGVSLGGALAGKFLGCDRSMKTDIEEVGIDPETGLMMYAFRYKADPKTYPKVVAPMSDEVEAKYPGSTVVIGGKRLLRMAA